MALQEKFEEVDIEVLGVEVTVETNKLKLKE